MIPIIQHDVQGGIHTALPLLGYLTGESRQTNRHTPRRATRKGAGWTHEICRCAGLECAPVRLLRNDMVGCCRPEISTESHDVRDWRVPWYASSDVVVPLLAESPYAC